MTDMQNNTPQEADDNQQNTPLQRVFKIGSTLIVEDESHIGLSNEAVRDALAFQFPEVANATISTSEQNGQLVVEFTNRPGRKG